MSEPLDRLQAAVPEAGQRGLPPIHLWQPELSGDIDIEIRRDGSWFHEGDPIRRQSLVNLFASILRREADGHYYLVTPVEKWRIRVQALPLTVVDFAFSTSSPTDAPPSGESENQQTLSVITNTSRTLPVSKDYPLFFSDALSADEPVLAVGLENGLAAMFTRSCWYRLVEECEQRDGRFGIESGGLFFPLDE